METKYYVTTNNDVVPDNIIKKAYFLISGQELSSENFPLFTKLCLGISHEIPADPEVILNHGSYVYAIKCYQEKNNCGAVEAMNAVQKIQKGNTTCY